MNIMNIKRYINDKETPNTEFSEIFIDNEAIDKTLFIVNERVKNNKNISRLDITEKHKQGGSM